MLFNNNNTGDISEEVNRLLIFINDFTATIGLENTPIDGHKLRSVVTGMHNDFPHIDGEEKASVFKKVANFVCYFVAEAPIEGSIPERFSEDLHRVKNSLTAVLAYEIAVTMLHKATIVWTRDNTEHTLENRITVSKHSYIDIIEALSAVTPASHFKLVAVLFEQMAYKTNLGCQYPLVE